MNIKGYNRLRILSWIVIAYLLLALGWWSVLLFIKNRDAFLAKSQLLKIGMIAKGQIHNDEAFLATAEYQELKRWYRHQELMIFGEALFFMVSLILGIWLINKGYNDVLRASRQQRNFLLSITHELKSPLASIRLVLETLERRTLPPPRRKTLIERALSETERLDELVNNLLLSARLDASWQPVFETCNLLEKAQKLLNQYQARFAQIQFQLHASPALPPIQADCQALEMALRNLLENATKYAPQSKQIELSLALKETEKTLVISLSDQGPGIPDWEKKRIFDKFYRVGNEETRTTKGTGLGLYIVRQIVHAHGGQIDVMDNYPSGARFVIKIPIHPTDKKTKNNAHSIG